MKTSVTEGGDDFAEPLDFDKTPLRGNSTAKSKKQRRQISFTNANRLGYRNMGMNFTHNVRRTVQFSPDRKEDRKKVLEIKLI